jgi:hypothetical protein
VTTSTPEGPSRAAALVRLIEEEIRSMHDLIDEAAARQWEASPVPKPREDTTERSSGGRPSDPTADTALDARRLAVRATLLAAEPVLRDAAVALRGSRLALARAIDRFDGDPGARA